MSWYILTHRLRLKKAKSKADNVTDVGIGAYQYQY
jgi:hypothetical protein